MQEQLGLRFHRLELLREALTHTSYVNENPGDVTADNERLEFLGDAVLDLLVAEDLYVSYPAAHEGQLTAMRAALVRTDTLAQVSDCINLRRHLLLGHGEEASGGRGRAANLCAALEALVGAIYLDQGLPEARALVRRLLSEAFQAVGQVSAMRDAKSLLQELVQGRLHCTPAYRTVCERGPDHVKEFVIEALVGGQVVGQGRGSSKQAAEQAAAQAALQNPDVGQLGSSPAGAQR